MKHYSFEYTNQRSALILISCCIISCLVVVLIGFETIGKGEGKEFLLVITIAAIIPIIIFRLNKNKVKRYGTATFFDTYLEFTLDINSEKILFKDLNFYNIYKGTNGTLFTLSFLNNKKLKIVTHYLYCKINDFDLFCDDFEKEIVHLKSNGKTDVKKEKSIYVKKGMLYFLIFATIGIIVSFYLGNRPFKIGISVGGGMWLFVMWTKYYLENKKNIQE